jgi:hypothetical protein
MHVDDLHIDNNRHSCRHTHSLNTDDGLANERKTRRNRFSFSFGILVSGGSVFNQFFGRRMIFRQDVHEIRSQQMIAEEFEVSVLTRRKWIAEAFQKLFLLVG